MSEAQPKSYRDLYGGKWEQLRTRKDDTLYGRTLLRPEDFRHQTVTTRDPRGYDVKVHYVREGSGEQRSRHSCVERLGVDEAPHLVEPECAAPTSEKALHFPAHAVQLGYVMRREDRARQSGQVVAVFAAKRDANDARLDGAFAVNDLDIEIEHALVVDPAKSASVCETKRLAVVV